MAEEKKRLCVLVFTGQGSDYIDAQDTRDRLVLYSSNSPLGSLLLSECHSTFHSEFSSLNTHERVQSGISENDFLLKDTLLKIPHEKYLQNAMITLTNIFLLQSLRYLSFIDVLTSGGESPAKLRDSLQYMSELGVGVLGFSSGILPACVAATSSTMSSFISRTVQTFRLVFWIGLRAQLNRMNILGMAALPSNTDPWSLVILGMSKSNLEEEIRGFNQTIDGELFTTAIVDENCLTVSGRPDHLASFSNWISTKCIIRPTMVNSLYHVPTQNEGIRNQVLADVSRRQLAFPNFADLIAPLRCTHSGNLISSECSKGSLLRQVLDMVFIHPVQWVIAVRCTSEAVPRGHSIQIVNIGPGHALAHQVERAFHHQQISSFDFPTNYVDQSTGTKNDRIAIIGMSIRMPGAPNVKALWHLLEDGVSTLSEVPASRFKVSDYNSHQHIGRSMKTRTGNFLDNVDHFDHKFFKISPREARTMDPQQRLLLHVAYEALEDSGYVPHATPTFDPDTFGCFIGAATNDYVHNLRDDIDLYYTTGTLPAFLSGRISYAMSMSGPSMVVDTACSSSSVALYHAVRALRDGDCNAALVGGVNVITGPDMFLGLDRGHFLSPAGQCRPFDADADGYSRGEGCGVFVLKRLVDAINEKDKVLGIIRGVELNQNGKASSITRPHVPTQVALLRSLLSKTCVSANDVNFIEAHAAGTQVGDTYEMESIRTAIGSDRTSHNPLYISSVKGNIGHLEAASGSASLVKVLLMLQHKIIPPQTSFRSINPHIPVLSSDHIVIAERSISWKTAVPGVARHAIVNNFGAAGTNVAILVEEHLESAVVSISPSSGQYFIFGMSADDPSVLEQLRGNYLAWLENPENIDVPIFDMAYTSTARRQLYDYRLCISGANKKDIIENLTCAPIVPVPENETKVVFVFSGQGSYYSGMGCSLYKTSATFQGHIDECNDILVKAGFPGIIHCITGCDDGSSPEDGSLPQQLALFALEYALSKLWISWGLNPIVVIGHSLGEYAAMVTSNIISLEDAMMILATRARLMDRYCTRNSTGMMAVALDGDVLQHLLDTDSRLLGLSISCFNSTKSFTISGPLPQLEIFSIYLRSIDCYHTMLHVPFGYHSSAMDPLLEEFLEIVNIVKFSKPSIPIISNVTGKVVYPKDDFVFDANYLASHCCKPVNFCQGIQSFLSVLLPTAGSGICWLEIGPHSSVLPLIRSHTMVPRNDIFLASLNRRELDWSTISASLSRLYLTGLDIKWREVFDQIGPANCISLPAYPFRGLSFWVPYQDPTAQSSLPSNAKSRLNCTLLQSWTQIPHHTNNWVAIFEAPVSCLEDFIRGHQVGGVMLCPASLYIETALSALNLIEKSLDYRDQDSRYIQNVEFLKPLVLGENDGSFILTVKLLEDHDTFTVSTRPSTMAEIETVHAQGVFRSHTFNQIDEKFTRKLPSVQARIAALQSTSDIDSFSSSIIYDVIFPRVVKYSAEYRSLQRMVVSPDRMDACAVMQLPADTFDGTFVVHPVFLDTMVHTAGFLANLSDNLDHCFVCVGIGSLKLIPSAFDKASSYTSYCTVDRCSDRQEMSMQTYVIKSGSPPTLVASLKGIRFRGLPIHVFQGLSPPLSIPSTLQMLHQDKVIQDWRLKSACAPEFSLQSITTQVAHIISDISHTPTEELFLDTDFNALGVDPMMKVEISKQLQMAYPSCKIDDLQFCGSQNLSEIVNYISSELGIVDRPVFEPPFPSSSCATLVGGNNSPTSSPGTSQRPPDLRHILCDSLKYRHDELADGSKLSSLGLDSLTSIEIIHILKSQYRLKLPFNFFEKYTTLADAQLRLDDLHSNHTSVGNRSVASFGQHPTGVDESPNQFLRRLQTSFSGKTALWIIHDGSGLTHHYEKLDDLDRTVWALGNPRFSSNQAWSSIVEMATAYIRILKNEMLDTVILAGWSFGGVVAFEIAKQLALQNVHVKGVILMDSPSPLDVVPLSETLIDYILDFDRSSHLQLDARKLVKRQFLTNSDLLANYDHQHTRSPTPRLSFLRCMEGFKLPTSKNIDVPPWFVDREEPASASSGWDKILGSSIKVFDIPGHHFELFETSHAGRVSQTILEACEYLETLV